MVISQKKLAFQDEVNEVHLLTLLFKYLTRMTYTTKLRNT